MTEKRYSDGSVWQEFVKIAAESGLITTDLNPEKKDFVGNPSKSPVGPFRENGGSTKEGGAAELYDVTKETGEELIGKAHPKTIQIADAMGAGGVVENQVEQQQKNLDIATKMPSGALYGVHAELVKELAKKANELEEQGKIKEAMRIDQTIKRIAALPFPNRQANIKKEALWPALLLGLSALTGVVGAANMGFFSSKREDLATDLKDLEVVLGKAAPDSPSAKKAQALLRPFVPKFKSLSFKNNKDIDIFSEELSAFKPVLAQVSSLVARMELELGESRWFEFGMDRPSRTKAKLEDVVKDIKFIEQRLQKISEVGEKVAIQPKVPQRVNGLQDVLVEQGLLEKASGMLDEATISAAASLEKRIDKDLDALGIKRKSPFVGKIVSGGKIVMDPVKLQRILSLIEMAKSK